jgi:hypothetical protein
MMTDRDLAISSAWRKDEPRYLLQPLLKEVLTVEKHRALPFFRVLHIQERNSYRTGKLMSWYACHFCNSQQTEQHCLKQKPNYIPQ